MQSFGKLGWIGLGNMGSRIAKRLWNAGYPLIVYNRDRPKAEGLASQGAELAASLVELVDADVIFSCLSDGAAIGSVYFGPDGLLHRVKPGAHIVEMSTVAPEASLHLFRAGRERGISVLDAAISGSTPAVESGSLTLFIGGDRQAFEFMMPFFRAIARQWFTWGTASTSEEINVFANLAVRLHRSR